MTQDEFRRQELGDFLRTRRARVAPSDVGLVATPRRRAPGLRREEVAQLAGISASWYAWLEQKRPIHVSARTLDNLARVLQLNPAERIQLFQLALRQPAIEGASQGERVSSATQRMLDQLDRMPAFIRGRRQNILAWNHAARAFFFDFEKVPPGERNLVWLFFTSQELRSLIGVDWRARAQDVLARFRLDYGRYAGDADFLQLVERLTAVSPEFARWWPRLDVLPQSEGRKQYNHSVAGLIVAEHFTWSMTDNPDLRITIFSPADPKSMARMRALVTAHRNGWRVRGRRQNDIAPGAD
jgi:transcriptional regulator with XRE-family HTH domain